MPTLRSKKFILTFSEVTNTDVGLVGGKNASLGEMYQKLTHRGVRVPDGYAITASAYRQFLQETGLRREIKRILKSLDTHDVRNLREHGRKVRQAILKAEFPPELKKAITEGYAKLQKRYGKNLAVAVRSSATAEDLPDASFAGQQDTFLNVRGNAALLEACKKAFASLFTDRAISYREDKGFDHFTIALSIGVQKMVRAAVSGVMFSIDTETGFRNAVLINAAYGLGENIVQGAVNPDEFYVFKPTLGMKGKKPIIKKKLGTKALRMVYAKGRRKPTKNVPVPIPERVKFSLTDREVLHLARWAVQIEAHYGKPMDMEWAKDEETGQLFIVQARPETVQSQRDMSVLEEYTLLGSGRVLTTGSPVGTKIGAGKAHIILSAEHIHEFKKGEVLVTDMTDPDWEPIMKIASAIVTNKGGRTSHAAIVSRELGIPAIVGTDNATRKIPNGRPVTVSCAEGDVGKVYSGTLPFRVRKTSVKHLKRPKTKIMMNLGNPEQAFSASFIPNDGVGLARIEFVINSYIKAHPLALVNFAHLKNKQAKAQIASITTGYRDKKQFFIEKLAEGVGMIAAAFYPKDVIVRLSDFKSNEYANLIGGRAYEPVEENPMLGWRGASRYYSEKFAPAFALECKALKKVREEFGLTNVKLMIPICRTVEEGRKVLQALAKHGLKKGVRGLEVYVMAELPANAVLAEDFAKIFDGFSIGSNDLTQTTLGVDRDSELVSHIYDERNPAVKAMLSMIIRTAKANSCKVGICGQAPSDYPEIARFITEEGIDSMSLNPDTVVKTTIDVLKTEGKLGRRR